METGRRVRKPEFKRETPRNGYRCGQEWVKPKSTVSASQTRAPIWVPGTPLPVQLPAKCLKGQQK